MLLAQINYGHSHSPSRFKCFSTARIWFAHRFAKPVRSLRSRNSRNFVGGNHESRTTDKENPASQPIRNSPITAGFFLYSRITRSISAESRITQNPFQTLLYTYFIFVSSFSQLSLQVCNFLLVLFLSKYLLSPMMIYFKRAHTCLTRIAFANHRRHV